MGLEDEQKTMKNIVTGVCFCFCFVLVCLNFLISLAKYYSKGMGAGYTTGKKVFRVCNLYEFYYVPLDM